MTAIYMPEEASAAQAIESIGAELAMFDDWMDRYEFIIELGRKLPPYPAEWQDEAHRVRGCQSQVWLASAEKAASSGSPAPRMPPSSPGSWRWCCGFIQAAAGRRSSPPRQNSCTIWG